MQTIRPAGKQVFAREQAKQTTTGNFLLAEESAYKPVAATVIAVGHDINWIQPNDTIIYKSYTTTEIKLDEIDYILVHEEDILGIIDENPSDS